MYLAIFSRHIPSSVKRSMVERLEHLSGGGLHREMRSYLVQSDRGAKDYSELFLNIDLLSEAIAAKKKVSFNYSSYGADKKLRIDERVITASPLGIGASDGDFYLLSPELLSDSQYQAARLPDLLSELPGREFRH